MVDTCTDTAQNKLSPTSKIHSKLLPCHFQQKPDKIRGERRDYETAGKQVFPFWKEIFWTAAFHRGRHWAETNVGSSDLWLTILSSHVKQKAVKRYEAVNLWTEYWMKIFENSEEMLRASQSLKGAWQAVPEWKPLLTKRLLCGREAAWPDIATPACQLVSADFGDYCEKFRH